MLNILWQMNAERLVSHGVPACSESVVDYRDRQSVHGAIRSDVRVVGSLGCASRVADATSPVTFTHVTVNPLVPRPRAKHG